jgi:hypothetical protein
MKLWPDRIPGVRRAELHASAGGNCPTCSARLPCSASTKTSLGRYSRSERLPSDFTSGLHWLMRCRIYCTAIARKQPRPSQLSSAAPRASLAFNLSKIIPGHDVVALAFLKSRILSDFAYALYQHRSAPTDPPWNNRARLRLSA